MARNKVERTNWIWYLVVDRSTGDILEGFNSRPGAEHFVEFREKHGNPQYGSEVDIVCVKEAVPFVGNSVR
jgi:hypothetical protein